MSAKTANDMSAAPGKMEPEQMVSSRLARFCLGLGIAGLISPFLFFFAFNACQNALQVMNRAAVDLVVTLSAYCMVFGGAGFGLPAVVCGHVARWKTRKSVAPVDERNVTMTGLVSGYLGIAATVIIIALIAWRWDAK